VVLITDGEPTYGVGCVGNGTALETNIKPEYITDTLDAIDGAWNVPSPNIPIGTFVIGSPGSEKNYSGADARPWLSEAARLGGTNPIDCNDNGPNYCHFDLTDPNLDFAAGLNNALAQILGQVVACEYYPPADPRGLTINFDDVGVKFINGAQENFVVPKVTEADCNVGAQGWYWNSDMSRILLCGATCGLSRRRIRPWMSPSRRTSAPWFRSTRTKVTVMKEGR
jgi:hypothetical protein